MDQFCRASGLKINLQKSSLLGIRLSEGKKLHWLWSLHLLPSGLDLPSTSVCLSGIVLDGNIFRPSSCEGFKVIGRDSFCLKDGTYSSSFIGSPDIKVCKS